MHLTKQADALGERRWHPWESRWRGMVQLGDWAVKVTQDITAEPIQLHPVPPHRST
jgi:hypothetical protein